MSTPPEPTTPPAAALPPITAADAGGEFSAADAAGVVAALKSPSIRGKLAQLEKLGLDGYQNVLTALGVPGKDSGQADRVEFADRKGARKMLSLAEARKCAVAIGLDGWHAQFQIACNAIVSHSHRDACAHLNLAGS